MDVLLGTTNPSKVSMFENWLEGEEIRFLTLREVSIPGEPEENGVTPAENARQKAEYYGRYADYVICNDSGLYLAGLPMEDARQPGLHVRTPQGARHRLDDEEMIAYYAGLAHSLGGRVRACYLSGFAVKTPKGLSLYEDRMEELLEHTFWLTDTTCAERRPGWPLDSLSLYKDGKTSFLEPEPPEWLKGGNGNRHRWIAFLKESLGLQARSE